MKILKSIGFYFVYPFCTFCLGILSHVLYIDYFYPNKYTITTEKEISENKIYPVTSLEETIITCDTRYIIKEYDENSNTEQIVENSIPDKYLGMNREMLEESLKEYLTDPTLEDMEKGITDIQLTSFSSDEIEIKKIYNYQNEHPGYYLMIQNGKIVVMNHDKRTIYLSTDIYAEALSNSLKQELLQGKYINDIDELYMILKIHTIHQYHL